MIRRAPEPVVDRSAIAADRIDGAKRIAKFWFDRDDPEACKRLYRLIERKVIRVGKVGGRLIASRRKLTEDYERLTSGEVEAAE